jgi:ferredoxin
VRYTVDQALCAGHGQCFVLAPEVFEPDDEGLNRDVGRTVEADDRHRRQVDWAARGCPEQAIRVLTTSTP